MRYILDSPTSYSRLAWSVAYNYVVYPYMHNHFCSQHARRFMQYCDLIHTSNNLIIILNFVECEGNFDSNGDCINGFVSPDCCNCPTGLTEVAGVCSEFHC